MASFARSARAAQAAGSHDASSSGMTRTPANGPFVILGARLSTELDDPTYPDWAARRSPDWLEEHLVHADGTVEDGKNREEDGRIDPDRQHTYNYGLPPNASSGAFCP